MRAPEVLAERLVRLARVELRRRRLGHKPDDAVYLEIEIVQRGKLVDGGPDAE